jgi:hypothetical protein
VTRLEAENRLKKLIEREIESRGKAWSDKSINELVKEALPANVDDASYFESEMYVREFVDWYYHE